MKFSRFLLSIVLVILVGYSSCNQDKQAQTAENQTIKTNKSIPNYTLKEGVLTVLMDNSLTSYFIFQGEAMGYEYEMLKLFAEENNLKLDVKIINQVENILDSLTVGKGDLAAANLAITKNRMEQVAFTESLFRTKQILVQRLPENVATLTRDQIEGNLVRDRLDLADESVMVRKNSSYELTLQNLISETGLNVTIEYGPGDLVTEHLIDMVSSGTIDYTICDQNKAELFKALHENIDIITPMTLNQPIAWAVNKESTELLDQLNDWIANRIGSLEYNMINNRYFEMNRRKEKLLSKEYDLVKQGKISEYDAIIKRYATTLNWDWRLLTAQIYKESHFNPKTRSWRGAIGLMQLLPRTANSYGVSKNELTEPEKNIMAGTKHLKMLEDHWKSSLTDSMEIVKFTLGAYNVGHGHVEDAINLAKKHDLDPKKWDDNVAQMLLNKSIPKYYKDPVVKYGYCRGREPVNYVTTIFENYELYRQFTD